MNHALLTDLALAPVAGYAGTKLMEPVSSKLYELEGQADREQVDAVRPFALGRSPPQRRSARSTLPVTSSS